MCWVRLLLRQLETRRAYRRYGSALIPMDETLASVALDISGRPYIVYNVSLPKRGKIKEFEADLIEDFFQALVTNSGITHTSISAMAATSTTSSRPCSRHLQGRLTSHYD